MGNSNYDARIGDYDFSKKVRHTWFEWFIMVLIFIVISWLLFIIFTLKSYYFIP